MSLVVGRIHEGSIYIIGDIALGYSDQIRGEPLVTGCLKQYRLTEHLAIAFAGRQDFFQAACASLLAATTGDQVLHLAIEAQSRLGPFDVLIADANSESLVFLKEGEVTQGDAGFIGDHRAYDSYQQCFHGAPDPELGVMDVLRIPEPTTNGSIYQQMFQAFRRVIFDPQCTTVAGAIVSLALDKGAFSYMCYASSSLLRDFSDQSRLYFGSAEEGGYSMEFSESHTKKEPGFFFLQGGFGVIFPPNAHGFRTAELLRAKTPTEWALTTKHRLGDHICSMYLTSHDSNGSGAIGERLMQEGRLEDAAFCFSLGDIPRLQAEHPAIADRYVAAYAAVLADSGKPEVSLQLLTQHISGGYPTVFTGPVLSELLPKA